MNKIVFSTTSVSREGGGLFTAMTGLAGGLLRCGHRLTVAGTLDDHTARDLAAWGAVAVRTAAIRGPRSLSYAPGLGAILDGVGADLAHHHGIWTWSSAACHDWASRTGRPYVVSPHGMLDPWITTRGRLKKAIANRWYQRRHLRQARCLAALCQAEAESIRRYEPGLRIAIVPNGIDLPRLDRPRPEAPWAEVARGRRVLLFLGRLHRKKGLDELIDAVAILQKRHPTWSADWLVAIAGWGIDGYPEDVSKRIAEAGLSHQIMMVGPVFGDAKRACLLHASAFILPSHSEGLPMSVLEAWSFGLPVLMTDACNLPEGFAANAAQRISVDSSRLADHLVALTTHSTSDLNAQGQRGFTLVRDQFTWDAVAHRCDEMYQWCLGGGPPPASVMT